MDKITRSHPQLATEFTVLFQSYILEYAEIRASKHSDSFSQDTRELLHGYNGYIVKDSNTPRL